VTNAGDAISPGDYVTKRQLDGAARTFAAGADPTPESGWRKVGGRIQQLDPLDEVFIGRLDAVPSVAPLVVRGLIESLGDSASADSSAAMQIRFCDDDGAVAPELFIVRSRGTLANGTAVQDDDLIGRVSFQGHTGGTLVTGALVRAEAAQTWTDSVAGTRLVIAVNKTGALSTTKLLQIENGTVALGEGIATDATSGHVEIPACAGTPTGVPVAVGTNTIPLVYDSTNNILYAYSNGAWRTH
jgi:hypothetical protein